MSNNKQGHIFQSLRSVFLLLVMPGRKDPLHSWRCPQHSWRCHLPSTAFSSYEVSYGRLYPMETSDSEWSDNGVHFLKKSFVVLQEGVQSIQWPKRPRLLIDKVDNLAKEAWQELTRRVVEEVGNDVQHSCKQHWKKGIAICGEWPKARILGRVFFGQCASGRLTAQLVRSVSSRLRVVEQLFFQKDSRRWRRVGHEIREAQVCSVISELLRPPREPPEQLVFDSCYILIAPWSWTMVGYVGCGNQHKRQHHDPSNEIPLYAEDSGWLMAWWPFWSMKPPKELVC